MIRTKKLNPSASAISFPESAAGMIPFIYHSWSVPTSYLRPLTKTNISSEIIIPMRIEETLTTLIEVIEVIRVLKVLLVTTL